MLFRSLPLSSPCSPTSPPFTHRLLAMCMRYRPARLDSVVLSNQTAFALCDSLLQMTRFWIIELPEPELREIRNALGSLLVRTDQVLDLMESEICLDFESLRVDSSELPGYDPSSSNVCLSQILTTLLEPRTLVRWLLQAPSHQILASKIPSTQTVRTTPPN